MIDLILVLAFFIIPMCVCPSLDILSTCKVISPPAGFCLPCQTCIFLLHAFRYALHVCVCVCVCVSVCVCVWVCVCVCVSIITSAPLCQSECVLVYSFLSLAIVMFLVVSLHYVHSCFSSFCPAYSWHWLDPRAVISPGVMEPMCTVCMLPLFTIHLIIILFMYFCYNPASNLRERCWINAFYGLATLDADALSDVLITLIMGTLRTQVMSSSHVVFTPGVKIAWAQCIVPT